MKLNFGHITFILTLLLTPTIEFSMEYPPAPSNTATAPKIAVQNKIKQVINTDNNTITYSTLDNKTNASHSYTLNTFSGEINNDQIDSEAAKHLYLALKITFKSQSSGGITQE